MRNKLILLLLIVTLGVSLKLLFPDHKQLAPEIESSGLAQELETFPGKDIFDTLPQWFLKKNRSFYVTGEFDKLLSTTDVSLDKDVFLHLGVFINKPVTVKSKDDRKKIYIYNTSVAFSIFSSDVVFENIDFYLTNVNFFVQGRDDQIKAMPQNLKFKNCRFYLHGRSQATIQMNQVIIENSLFQNNRKTFLSESSILWFTGNNLSITNSTFVDLLGGADYPIYLREAEQVIFENNVVVAFQNELKGLITVSKSKHIKISNNYLEDINFKEKSLALSSPAKDEEDVVEANLDFLEGGIGVWLTDAEDVQINENLWGTTNERFDQNQNKKILSSLVWHSQLKDQLELNCADNDKIKEILTHNHYLRCQN